MAFNAVATHNPFYIFHILARKTCNPKTASIPGPLTILKKNKPKNKHGGRKHMLEVLRQNFELLSRSQQKRFAPDGFRIYGACVLFGHVFTSALYLRCTSCSALRKWSEGIFFKFVPVLFSDKSRPGCYHAKVPSLFGEISQRGWWVLGNARSNGDI